MPNYTVILSKKAQKQLDTLSDNVAMPILKAIIGRYERGEINPSVEVAAKIAEALEVSLDYLVGNTTVLVKDKKMLYRLELLEKISDPNRETILSVVASFLNEVQHNSTSKKFKA
jgi:transcriptional regulator with XRE-family HTH domain